jgi:hypothetical protein
VWADASRQVQDVRKRNQLKNYVDCMYAYLKRYYEYKINDGPVLKASEQLDKPLDDGFGLKAPSFFDTVRDCSVLCLDLSRQESDAKKALEKLSNTAWLYVEAAAADNEAATRHDNASPFAIVKAARGLDLGTSPLGGNRPDGPPIAAPRRAPVGRNPDVTIAGSRAPRPSREPPTGEPGGAPPLRIEPPPTGEPSRRIEDVEQAGGQRFAPPREPQNGDLRGTWEQLDELERQGTWDQWDAVRLAD